MADPPKFTLPFTPTDQTWAFISDPKQGAAFLERASKDLLALRDTLIQQAPKGVNPEVIQGLLAFAMSDFLARMIASKPDKTERDAMIQVFAEAVETEHRRRKH